MPQWLVKEKALRDIHKLLRNRSVFKAAEEERVTWKGANRTAQHKECYNAFKTVEFHIQEGFLFQEWRWDKGLPEERKWDPTASSPTLHLIAKGSPSGRRSEGALADSPKNKEAMRHLGWNYFPPLTFFNVFDYWKQSYLTVWSSQSSKTEATIIQEEKT